MNIDPGKLREVVTLLTPAEREDGQVKWEEVRKARAAVEPGTARNLFSSVGLGAETRVFTLRRQPLAQGDLLVLGEQAHYVTALRRIEDTYLEATTAQVTVVELKVERNRDEKGPNGRPTRVRAALPGIQAIITEKYVGYALGTAHAETVSTYVLITPKQAALEEGDLVTPATGALEGRIYNVTAVHPLDPVKNEYEMTLRKDV